MPIPLLNTRATIEDFYKGVIDEIIFESYGTSEDFIIIHPEKLAYEIGRDLCDYKKKIDIDDITWAIENALDDIKCSIGKFLIEYIENNFEGEYKK